MNDTYVTMCGYVATDPQTRLTRAEVPFVTFRLASTPRRVDHTTGEYVDAGTSFVNVTAFRALGANVAGSIAKGQPVLVYGRMRVNQWTGSDGRTGTSVEVEAFSVGFDMARGRSTFERVRPPQPPGHAGGEQAAPPAPSSAGMTAAGVTAEEDGVAGQPHERELVGAGDSGGTAAGR